ncbi:Rho/RAC guanine nucleotide exchange factor, putative [Entamoeba invadens IP1]|uniref:Rho/RAC guanine nucleotide exchange factor, putative n=1 Tax=Entamoeba invadens IP1 TaxID=370355 RepID=A0A0A1U748_ENTIV|nr:Rho/RAC guanine nucleotide exchange factor, putative [Entamoeba invadens IP1]ELP88827.1 Rho/RAC guanine nucleotide exchange factor, putative [Entamoeba invadens IP1]|eukprot:XP_004255598.1 Rho/RAC guanine nucleotide exchange factor, putative [Entamoeba invadens IP1]
MSEGTKEVSTKREHIVNEIYTTEDSYVKSLKICVDVYMAYFASCPDTTESTQTEIFLYLQEVLNIATAFLADMTEYKQKGSLSDSVGECFQRFIPFLKVYKLFIGNNEVCLGSIAKLEKSEEATAYLEQCRLKIEGPSQQPLRSLLIMPVQRIPRYVLLIKDLLKNTDESHKDHKTLEIVLGEMEDLAKVCNAALVNTERMMKMFKIRDSIRGYEGELINSSRYFIKEGFLTKQCRKVPKPRYFYLFNDIMMYGIESLGTVSVSGTMDLLDCIVTNIPDSPSRRLAFQIQSGNKSFVVFAKNQEDKNCWLDTINTAIEKQTTTLSARTNKSTIVRPVFKPDIEALNCELCHIDFTFFVRRHHCRACGRCICGECSKWKMPMPPNNDMERVCAKCFDLYNKNKKNSKGEKVQVREKGMANVISTKSVFEQQQILSGKDEKNLNEDEWQEFEDLSFGSDSEEVQKTKTPIKSGPQVTQKVDKVVEKQQVEAQVKPQTIKNDQKTEIPKRRPPPPPPQKMKSVDHTIGEPKKAQPPLPQKLVKCQSEIVPENHQRPSPPQHSHLTEASRMSYKSFVFWASES